MILAHIVRNTRRKRTSELAWKNVPVGGTTVGNMGGFKEHGKRFRRKHGWSTATRRRVPQHPRGWRLKQGSEQSRGTARELHRDHPLRQVCKQEGYGSFFSPQKSDETATFLHVILPPPNSPPSLPSPPLPSISPINPPFPRIPTPLSPPCLPLFHRPRSTIRPTNRTNERTTQRPQKGSEVLSSTALSTEIAVCHAYRPDDRHKMHGANAHQPYTKQLTTTRTKMTSC